MNGHRKAHITEIAVVVLLVSYGPFSAARLVLLLLWASYSLWIRGSGWTAVGLRRPSTSWNSVGRAAVTAAAILVLARTAIVPFSVWATGQPVDLSGLVSPGDTRALVVWLVQAWTLAAFGEEMVFRGFIIERVIDLVGDTRLGVTVAVVCSSVLFGLAHRYQGWGGVIATGVIGALLAGLYLRSRRNLWPVIMCHALVDTVGLAAMYLDQEWILVP